MTETKCVYCAVRSESLGKMHIKIRFQRIRVEMRLHYASLLWPNFEYGSLIND
jgi:hypothetical protein